MAERSVPRIGAVALLLALAPLGLRAQGGAAPRLDVVVERVTAAAQQVDFARANPAAAVALDSVAARLTASPADALSLERVAALVAAPAPPFTIVARWDRDDLPAGVDRRVVADVARLRQIAMTPLRAALEARLGTAATDSLLAPVDSLHAAILRAALARNREKLRRYAVKYGPDSPSLNGAEVLLNYAAQQLPAFGPSGDGWPGPLELVASWSTTELTAARDSGGRLRPRLVPAADVGVRIYRFAADTGGGRIARALHPRHLALGAAFMGASDAPLAAPWSGGTRAGAFLAWGDVVVAVVGGPHRRVLVTRALQILPYLF